jgi:hypothetical protein
VYAAGAAGDGAVAEGLNFWVGGVAGDFCFIEFLTTASLRYQGSKDGADG